MDWLQKHVPFYNDSTRAWNAINRLLVIPCAVPTTVYLEAAKDAVWQVAFSILSPDPKEVYHTLRGNSLSHDIKAGLEDAGIVPARGDNAATRASFAFADTIDVALWYMFLFSTATEGLVDFSSQVQRHAGCNALDKPNLFQGGPWVNAIGADGRYYADLFQRQNVPDLQVGTAGFSLQKGQTGFAAASCKFCVFGGFPEVPTSTGVVQFDTGVVLDQGQSTTNSSGESTEGHTFYKTKNMAEEVYNAEVMSSYTGSDHLPLDEAFRSGDDWRGFAQQVFTKG